MMKARLSRNVQGKGIGSDKVDSLAVVPDNGGIDNILKTRGSQFTRTKIPGVEQVGAHAKADIGTPQHHCRISLAVVNRHA